MTSRDRRGGNSGKERDELLYPILEDRCHQEHNPIFHLMNEYTECIDADKVCEADFSKVLKPIREAKDIPESEKKVVMEIRKQFNNRNAARSFRNRESEAEKKEEKKIKEMEIEKGELEEEKKELNKEIYLLKTRSPPSPTIETTNCDEEIATFHDEMSKFDTGEITSI